MNESNEEREAQDALAHRLRDAREFLNLSQQFVATQARIGRTALSDIERGTRRVGSLELKRLASLYRLPVAHFLGEPIESELAGEGGNSTLRALARAAGEMSDADREQVLRFALFLKNFDLGKSHSSD